jgi:RNA polymerase sigma-70 factor (ECF subfamily)
VWHDGDTVQPTRVADSPQLTAADIFDRYGTLVSSLCWRMTRDSEKARDAAQEVWLAVLEGLPRFRGESEVSTWIYAIAWRVIGRYTTNERRYSIRSLSDFFEAAGEPPAPEGDDVDHRLWVRAMCDQCLAGTLQCLEPDVRLAYLLRDVADCPYDEIAAVLAADPAAVRQSVSRARRKLNRFLRGHCALVDPDGPCRCRMRRRVEQLDLPAEYARLRRAVGRARVYRESEQVLPPKQYWLGLV